MEDMAIHGGVYYNGLYHFNGCGNIIGFANIKNMPPQRKKQVRCGNCGSCAHKTVDCNLLELRYKEEEKEETTTSHEQDISVISSSATLTWKSSWKRFCSR